MTDNVQEMKEAMISIAQTLVRVRGDKPLDKAIFDAIDDAAKLLRWGDEDGSIDYVAAELFRRFGLSHPSA